MWQGGFKRTVSLGLIKLATFLHIYFAVIFYGIFNNYSKHMKGRRTMKKTLLVVVMLICMLVLIVGCSGKGGETNEVNEGGNALATIPDLELLTGSATGSWYTIGAGIADKFNENYNGFPMTAIPGPGSIGDVPVIAAGDSEIGMSYGPFLIAAANGEAPYDTKYENIRSICVLQPTVVQPMTTLDIKNFGEFVDKKMKGTVGLYPVGNASTYIISMILNQYGINEISNIESWGAKAYYADGASLADAWSDRHIDMQMPMLNVPAATVSEAMVARRDGKMMNLDDEIIEKLVKENGFSAYTIPAGTYEGQTEDCKTVGLPIVIFTNTDIDEELIYNFTKSIYENKDYFIGVHSSFSEFEPAAMNDGVAIELHPGAERFYKEIGLIK